MVRVTYTIDLPEWWGADECYRDGGHVAVVDLIQEDTVAFLDGGTWTVEMVSENNLDQTK